MASFSSLASMSARPIVADDRHSMAEAHVGVVVWLWHRAGRLEGRQRFGKRVGEVVPAGNGEAEIQKIV
jgi:hypothetical protein